MWGDVERRAGENGGRETAREGMNPPRRCKHLRGGRIDASEGQSESESLPSNSAIPQAGNGEALWAEPAEDACLSIVGHGEYNQSAKPKFLPASAPPPIVGSATP